MNRAGLKFSAEGGSVLAWLTPDQAEVAHLRFFSIYDIGSPAPREEVRGMGFPVRKNVRGVAQFGSALVTNPNIKI
ncbi:hypothetical protein BU251_04825 [Candidatus Velamenicoccus archaeovorus]|uniref:Uncharacterized protein n=1 Tax=Velamenicoccus archaeovorus TaxID=1930593 RepID=A0A410P4Q4_VELA1|nr:hypothetical protein BU251_04825 [Candidatus Velamenicoccus archaeovorus]